MLTFLSQNLATILISLALFAVVALVIVHLVRNRRKGKSSCGCNCAGCPMPGACHAGKPQANPHHS